MLRPLFEAGGSEVPTVRPAELAAYETYLDLLTQWNERMSLVSPKSLTTAFATHFVDSIRICEAAQPYRGDNAVSDVGTGAGFPGIVHAIRYPDCRIRLYERSLKKQTFLMAVITQLQLENVELDGAFEKRSSGLFFARAVLQRAELFSFFRQKLFPGSLLVTNLGGQSEYVPPPADFIVEKQTQYALPQDCGNRRVEIVRFVPRGTNNDKMAKR